MHSCCQSRLGLVKKSFPDYDEAVKGCRRQQKRMPDKRFEPYRCSVNTERWHIRTVRPKKGQS